MGGKLGKSAIGKFLTKTTFYYQNPALKQEVLGLEFTNPVGLSAGFDKDADLINILPEVGFSYSQVGTVTYNPYKGNKKPWTHRLKKSRAILVNYGLKNIGVKKVVEKIKGSTPNHNFLLSVSVGKTNSEDTVNDREGIKDYYNCLKYFVDHEVADFYTINISCPNTFGGEPFTEPEKLNNLLKNLSEIKHQKPVFLKMPINSSWDEFKSLCETAIKYGCSGVIIGNLNKNRNDPAVLDPIPKNLEGNVSGKPTKKLSNELISKTYQEFGDKLVIVGVGGIFSPEDAYEKIKRGASLLQIITGMIYEGPQLIGEINRGLVSLMKKDGYKNISQAVGTYHTKT